MNRRLTSCKAAGDRILSAVTISMLYLTLVGNCSSTHSWFSNTCNNMAVRPWYSIHKSRPGSHQDSPNRPRVLWTTKTLCLHCTISFRTPSISIAHYFTPTIIHHIWHSNIVNRLPILVCLTFEFLGIQIGAELSLISNLIIPNPQRADMRKQHKMTVQGREAIPCPKLKMEGKVMFTIEAFLCPNFHCQS